MCRDQNIELADRRAAFGKKAPDSPELQRSLLAKAHDFDRGRERVDEGMKPPGALSVSAIAQLSKTDGTNA